VPYGAPGEHRDERTVIVTDSTAYLGPLEKSLGIVVVPLHVTLGDWTFEEPTVPPGHFYARLAESGLTPSTSQPSPGAFLQVFDAADEPVLCLTCSSALSGTHSSAVLAAGMTSTPVTVIDTGTISGGLALVVATVARAGLPFEESVELARSLTGRVCSTWSSASAELLQAGGRLTAELPAGLAVLALEDGEVRVVASARSMKESVALQAERVLAAVAEHPSYVTVGHADVAVPADALADALVGRPGVLGVDRYVVGPATAAHTGPGTFGANYLRGEPA
jgi:DegV family protein with EDD domain